MIATRLFSNAHTPLFNPNIPKILIKCVANNIHLAASVNNKLIFKLSAGMIGYKGCQKTSPECAMKMIDICTLKLDEKKIDMVALEFNGINHARFVLLSRLKNSGLRICRISDTTGIPHNGNRKRKPRRL